MSNGGVPPSVAITGGVALIIAAFGWLYTDQGILINPPLFISWIFLLGLGLCLIGWGCASHSEYQKK